MDRRSDEYFEKFFTDVPRDTRESDNKNNNSSEKRDIFANSVWY